MNIIQSFPNFRARPWLATRRLFIFTPDGRDRYCPLPRSLASLLFLFPLSSFSPFPRDIRLRKSAQKRREEEGAANEIKAQNDAVCRRHPALHRPLHINIIHRQRLRSAAYVRRDSRTLLPRAVGISGLGRRIQRLKGRETKLHPVTAKIGACLAAA